MSSDNGNQAERHALEVPAELDGIRLDTVLAQLLPQYSRSSIKTWVDAGRVTLNGTVVKPRTAVCSGDRITLEADTAASSPLPDRSVPYAVVHADQDVIVVDKPAGVVVHPGAGNAARTLVNGLLARYPELASLPRAGLVHRIDKDTSGLLLVARNSHAYQTLVRMMAARAISRVYRAVAHGLVPADGTIDAPIARDPQLRTRMTVHSGGRRAVTHYRVVQRFDRHTLIEVSLDTGRTHQIRVHLAWLGFPLVGDPRYGKRPGRDAARSPGCAPPIDAFPRQALHAAQLQLKHPVDGSTSTFSAPLPADMQTLIEALEREQGRD